MEQITYLESLAGQGTSLITMTLAKTPRALDNAVKMLTEEYNTATNIKCRV